MRVGRGLFDEALYRGGERVVGMVDEHVTLTQRREEIGLLSLGRGEPWMGPPHVWDVLQLGTVEVVERPQDRQVDEPVNPHDLAVGDLQLPHEQVQQVVVDVVGDLKTYGRAEPPACQLALERL